MNNVAMNNLVYVWYRVMFLFFSGIFLGVKLLGCVVTLCLTFQGTARLFFSKVNVPFYIPAVVHEGSNFYTSLPAFVFMCFSL